MTNERRNQLIALRNALNDAGEPRYFYRDHAMDTIPGNGSAWNLKRIRLRNRINARLSK